MREQKKRVQVGFRVTEERQEELKIASARRRQSMQEMIEAGLELLLAMPVATPKPEELSPEEKRLVAEYRKATYEKRRRMLAFAVKDEELGPEVMPRERPAARRKSGSS